MHAFPGRRLRIYAASRPGCAAGRLADGEHKREDLEKLGTILWIIFVGFIGGIVARMLSPGPNNPTGFVLTTVLGVAGAFLATWLGQVIGWYGPNQGARFIGAIVGSLIILFVWNRLVANGVIRDPTVGGRW